MTAGSAAGHRQPEPGAGASRAGASVPERREQAPRSLDGRSRGRVDNRCFGGVDCGCRGRVGSRSFRGGASGAGASNAMSTMAGSRHRRGGVRRGHPCRFGSRQGIHQGRRGVVGGDRRHVLGGVHRSQGLPGRGVHRRRGLRCGAGRSWGYVQADGLDGRAILSGGIAGVGRGGIQSASSGTMSAGGRRPARLLRRQEPHPRQGLVDHVARRRARKSAAAHRPAPRPWLASTCSAIAICSSLLARLAAEANWLPPCAPTCRVRTATRPGGRCRC